jgi:hypothetical protein
MKSDNQYLFAYETLMNVQGNLRRSGKFKTYKSFLENSDRAYVDSLMKSYIEEKKWIQNIKANYKNEVKYIEDKVKDFHNSLKKLAELFKNYTKYEITNEGFILKKKKLNLIWLSNEKKNQFLNDFEDLLKKNKEFDNKIYSNKYFRNNDYGVKFRPENLEYVSLHEFKNELSNFVSSCMDVFSKIFPERFKYLYLDGAGSQGTERVFWKEMDETGFFRLDIPTLNPDIHISEIEKDEVLFEKQILPFLENRIRKFEREDHATSNFSYVYVLSNKSYPNTYKIGSTSGSPKQRAVDLSTTGVLHPFKVAFQIKIKNAEYYEFKTHKILNNFRVKNNREFFELDLDKIKDCLNQILYLSKEGEIELSFEEMKKKIIISK